MIKSAHLLIQQLEARSTEIAGLGLASSIPDDTLDKFLYNFANTPLELDRIGRAMTGLVRDFGMSTADATVSMRQLLSDRHFYGSYCELSAYEWLGRHQADFKAQIPLTSADVLNPNGCTIDGKFVHRDVYFDIKGMGFQFYVADRFKAALSKQLPHLQVTIDGPMDVSVKDIETFAFGQLQPLVKALSHGGIEKVIELGWSIRAVAPKRVMSSIHTIDAYKLAEENRFYPFKTAGQFARNDSFIMVFPYAAQFNPMLLQNFAGGTDIVFRSMARRAFIQLTKDQSPANALDRQVASGTSVSDAAKLLSGLLYINLENDEGSLYLNPNATHKMTRSHVEQVFDFSASLSMKIDDFAHDNY